MVKNKIKKEIKKEKLILDISDFKTFMKAADVLDNYSKLDISKEIDFSKIFVKNPTKENLKHLELATSGSRLGYMGSLIVAADLWSREFKIDLTPEFKKYLKSIRKKLA